MTYLDILKGLPIEVLASTLIYHETICGPYGWQVDYYITLSGNRYESRADAAKATLDWLNTEVRNDEP